MNFARLATSSLALLSTAVVAACANSDAGQPQVTQIVPADPALHSAQTPAPQAAAAAPQDLRVFFDSGASRPNAASRDTLDQAARLFREGDPLVMIVSGQSDTTGDARRNLMLSQERATSVARGLMDRGIPATRLQIVAKGESEPLIKTADDTAQPENRAVVITWRK